MEAIGEDGSVSLDQTRSIGEVQTGYTYFRDGDVAFAKITPCFENGKGALFSGLLSGIGFGTTELIVARPRKDYIDGHFLDWLVRSRDFRKAGESAMYGAGGQKRVPETFVRDFWIALPLLSEQRFIAAFLDRECGKIDALIAEQERLIALLEEKRQAVISHAVTKGLDPNAPMKDSGIPWIGMVPEGWEVVPASYRYEVQLGRMLNEARSSGEHMRPYLRVFDVQWGVINTSSLPMMDFPLETQERYRLRPGDLMVNEGGSYVGRSAIWRGELDECYYQKALHRLRPLNCDRDTAEFFFFVMEIATRRSVFVAGANQTTIDHLTAEQLRARRFAFPPMEEQRKISEYLQTQLPRIDELVSSSDSAISILSERRAALISAAVTGKIDVRGLVDLQEAA